MLIDGVKLPPGSFLQNPAIENGDSFPATGDLGALFFNKTLKALGVFNGLSWDAMGASQVQSIITAALAAQSVDLGNQYYTKTEVNSISTLIQQDRYTKSEADSRFATPDQVTASALAIVNGAPAALDTLIEIVAQMQADESGATAMLDVVNTKINQATLDLALSNLLQNQYSKVEVDAIANAVDQAHYSKLASDSRYALVDYAYSKAEADSRYLPAGYSYTKLDADTKFATITALNEATATNVTQSTLQTSYYNKTAIDATLGGYYTKSDLDAPITGRYSKSYIDQAFTGYYGKTEINSMLAGYYNAAQTDAAINTAVANVNAAALSGYSTTAQTQSMDSAILFSANSHADAAADAALYSANSNTASVASGLQTQINALGTPVDLSLYYTKVQADSRYAPSGYSYSIAEANAAISTALAHGSDPYVFKSYVDTALASVGAGNSYTKAESDANSATTLASAKSYTDTSLVTAKAYTDTNVAALTAAIAAKASNVQIVSGGFSGSIVPVAPTARYVFPRTTALVLAYITANVPSTVDTTFGLWKNGVKIQTLTLAANQTVTSATIAITGVTFNALTDYMQLSVETGGTGGSDMVVFIEYTN